MEIKELLRRIARPLFADEIDALKIWLTESNNKSELYKNSYEQLLKRFNSEVENNKSEIDRFCQTNFKEIPLIAYNQKREIRGEYYTVSLHELITPDSWEVHNLFKFLKFDGLNMLEKVKKIGNRIAKTLTWDSDNNLDTSGDYYLYPNEAIARKKCDCEDHALVACSTDLEIGGAWGHMKGVGYHAFNVFIFQEKLYVLDTVGDTAYTELHKPNSDYQIHYIITKNHAYKTSEKNINFGTLAGW